MPGQVFYNATRRLVLKGVDGVVFVADSSAAMVEENLESMKNLEQNLAEYGKSLASLPIVMLCLPLGGVSLYEVLAAYLALMLSVAAFGMISVACSSSLA